MKKIILIFALMLTTSLAFAQDTLPTTSNKSIATEPIPEEKEVVESNKGNWDFNVDASSFYLWRGQSWGNVGTPVVQPYFNYGLTDKFTVGVWATTNFTKVGGYMDEKINPKTGNAYPAVYDGYHEFDINISYQATPWLSVNFSDYYWPVADLNYQWSDYNGTDSSHSLDIWFVADFSALEKHAFPLTFTFSTLVGGNDYKVDVDENGNENIKRAFSTYAEFLYNLNNKKTGINLNPFVGFTLRNGGYYSYADYDNKPSFVNMGAKLLRDFEIGRSTLTPWVMYSHNAMRNSDNLLQGKRDWLMFGVTYSLAK